MHEKSYSAVRWLAKEQEDAWQVTGQHLQYFTLNALCYKQTALLLLLLYYEKIYP